MTFPKIGKDGCSTPVGVSLWVYHMSNFGEWMRMSNTAASPEQRFPKSLSSSSTLVGDILSETLNAFSTKTPTTRIPFSADIQFLDVRGERRHLKQLKAVAGEHGSVWVPGLLFPKPDSDGGRRSVEINLIADGKFQCVGYLRTRVSTRHYPALRQHLEAGVLIPIIGKVVGLGKSDDDIELMAFAKTDIIDFVGNSKK